MKKTAIILSTLTAVILVCGAVIFFNAGNLAKIAVEKAASDALGVRVTIQSLRIDFREKSVDVQGIRVANPQGFSADPALTIAQILIAAEDISADRLDFRRVVANDSNIYLEAGAGGLNLAQIRQQAIDNAAARRTDSTRDDVKVSIRDLAITGTTVHAAQTGTDSITMPPINMRNIGVDANGITIDQALADIVNHATIRIIRQAAGQNMLDGVQGTSDIPDAGTIRDNIIDRLQDRRL